ncbi:MAG: hypothetical protein WAV23_01290 [Minisyncoccia bacterium]
MKTNLFKKIKEINKILPDYYFWIFVVSSITIILYLDHISNNFLGRFFNLFEDMDNNLIVIILALVGWIISLFLQNINIKQQLKTEIKYDVYKQLVILHKETQDSLALFMAKARPPFILMESSMISFNLNLKKEYKGEWIPYTESDCILEGGAKWNSFISEMNNTYFNFGDKYVSMLYILSDWMAPIKNLNEVKDTLTKEINVIKNNISKNINILQMYSSKNDHDWRKWNKEEVEKITNDISNDAQSIGSYIGDFMVLIHNELLSEYFKYKRPIRKTFDEKYKVLTKKGIVINLETDKKKIKEFNKIISEINEKN